MNSKTNVIVVVEPHADDAYLSLHQHMVDWIKEGNKVVILTVFSGTRKRARDGQAYADSIGAQWDGLGYVEDPNDPKPFITGDKEFDPLPGMLGMLYGGNSNLTIVAPIGIQHPEHKAVSDWVRQCPAYYDALYFYAEIPYYSKLKNEEDANAMLVDHPIVSIKHPKHYKADEKYWKCFKDQSKFFHFNPAADMRDIVEIVVR